MATHAVVPLNEREVEGERAMIMRYYATLRQERPRFAYGAASATRSTARMRQAGRLYADRDNLSKEDLMTIEAEDILASALSGDDEGRVAGRR